MFKYKDETGREIAVDVNKERFRMDTAKHTMQSNMKTSIDTIESQMRMKQIQIKSFDEKRKDLIRTYNKDCSHDDRIRGTTPPCKKKVTRPMNIINTKRMNLMEEKITALENKLKEMSQKKQSTICAIM